MGFATLTVLFGLLGVMLIVAGAIASRRPAWSPPAEEDVRKFGTSARRPISGRVQIVVGVLLVGVGGFFGFFWYELHGISFSH